MEPLLEAGEMRELDRWAINEKKVAVDELMERAGEGLAGVVARRAPAGRIAIVCGKGNNGGDGIVAARLLRQAGRDVEVLLVWPAEWMGEDAQAQLKKLPGREADRVRGRAAQQGARDRRLRCSAPAAPGSPREPADQVIEEMEAAKAPVIAADVPSGRRRHDGRGRGAGGALRRHRDVPPAEGRAVGPARQGVRGRGRGRSTSASRAAARRGPRPG